MNVVFDVGGVLLKWEPEQIVAQEIKDPGLREQIRTGTFAHPEWSDLDRGTVSQVDLVDIGARRSGLSRAALQELMDRLTRSLTPIPGSIELVEAVKRAGNRVYVLSNMPAAAVDHLEREYTFWELFDGIVFSSRVHLVKPEPQIFHHLLDTHGLVSEETVFIDDTSVNLRAASEVGLKTIHFSTPDQCREALAQLGCVGAM